MKILKIDGTNLCIFNFGLKESTILNCFFCMHVLNENLFLFQVFVILEKTISTLLNISSFILACLVKGTPLLFFRNFQLSKTVFLVFKRKPWFSIVLILPQENPFKSCPIWLKMFFEIPTTISQSQFRAFPTISLSFFFFITWSWPETSS